MIHDRLSSLLDQRGLDSFSGVSFGLCSDLIAFISPSPLSLSSFSSYFFLAPSEFHLNQPVVQSSLLLFPNFSHFLLQRYELFFLLNGDVVTKRRTFSTSIRERDFFEEPPPVNTCMSCSKEIPQRMENNDELFGSWASDNGAIAVLIPLLLLLLLVRRSSSQFKRILFSSQMFTTAQSSFSVLVSMSPFLVFGFPWDSFNI